MSVQGQVRTDQNEQDRLDLQKDGQHDLVISPEMKRAAQQAVTAFVGNLFEPDVIEKLRRYIAKADRNDSRSISVGITPTRLLERDPSRVEAIIYNLGGQTVFIGGRQVTVGVLNDPSGGFPLLTNTGIILDNNIGELFAISGTAGQDVRVLELTGGI